MAEVCRVGGSRSIVERTDCFDLATSVAFSITILATFVKPTLNRLGYLQWMF